MLCWGAWHRCIGEKITLWSQFLSSIFTRVPGNELSLSSLCYKLAYPLGFLAGPVCLDSQQIICNDDGGKNSILFSFTGLYTYHVFPAVLEGQEAFIFWNPVKPDPWQQGSWPTLGTRHLLSQWQEIICAWGHSEKPNDKAASWWNCPLWTTVNTFLLPCFMSLVCFLVLKMGRRERSKKESRLHA